MGVSNIGSNRATLNPQTFWPTSSFKVPMTAGQGGNWTSPTTEFGSTTDYTTGALHTVPRPFSYSNPYSRFDASRKRVPQLPAAQRIPSSLRPRKKEPSEYDEYNQWQREQKMANDPDWQKHRRSKSSYIPQTRNPNNVFYGM